MILDRRTQYYDNAVLPKYMCKFGVVPKILTGCPVRIFQATRHTDSKIDLEKLEVKNTHEFAENNVR